MASLPANADPSRILFPFSAPYAAFEANILYRGIRITPPAQYVVVTGIEKVLQRNYYLSQSAKIAKVERTCPSEIDFLRSMITDSGRQMKNSLPRRKGESDFSASFAP
jgi:hypothetical protein